MTLSAEDESVLNVLPVGMQNSALVLKDEDGNSVTELEEWSNSTSDSNLSPAAINVENSSDVIIGPVTQFNGPVTIYQNVNGTQSTPSVTQNGEINHCLNGKLFKSESTSSDAPPPEKPKNSPTVSKHFKYLAASLALVVIIAIIATATILSLKKSETDLPTPLKPPFTGRTTNSVTPPGSTDGPIPAGPGLIIEKSKWGGRPALQWNDSLELHHPTEFVIISHSVTPQCKNFDACSTRVRNIQSYHIGNGKSPDIGYNFVIGGDGNAYVGRGWDVRNFHINNSIGICFIGDYTVDRLTADMISIVQKLIQEGVDTGKLAKKYKLIGHNQIYNTVSPGRYVIEEIKKWPHYDPTRYI